MAHLGENAIMLVDGKLDHTERDRALAHLTYCADCRREVEAMRALKSRLRSLDGPAMPADLTMSLVRMGESGGPLPPRERPFSARSFGGVPIPRHNPDPPSDHSRFRLFRRKNPPTPVDAEGLRSLIATQQDHYNVQAERMLNAEAIDERLRQARDRARERVAGPTESPEGSGTATPRIRRVWPGDGAGWLVRALVALVAVWQSFVAFIKGQRRHGPLGEEGGPLTAEARRMLYVESQSQITATQAAAVADLLTALKSNQNALLAFYNILIIKVDGVSHVRELAPEQVEHLRKNPALYTDPRAALSEIDSGRPRKGTRMTGDDIDNGASPAC